MVPVVSWLGKEGWKEKRYSTFIESRRVMKEISNWGGTKDQPSISGIKFFLVSRQEALSPRSKKVLVLNPDSCWVFSCGVCMLLARVLRFLPPSKTCMIGHFSSQYPRPRYWLRTRVLDSDYLLLLTPGWVKCLNLTVILCVIATINLTFNVKWQHANVIH